MIKLDKWKKATLILALYLIGVTAVYGAVSYWIYSPEESVTTGEYVLGDLTVSNHNPVLYEIVTISGNLTYGGSPVNAATITLFKDDVSIDTTSTDSGGLYSFSWNATEIGTVTFKTGYEVTS